ncbi:hypothetical protein Dda_6770 [Drechslerella dactyloides]|uniref:Uncharacterized protein n=1 Tax=Drechslerella dactyloides TaxID=74499 RepID=A0AAD6IU41_DREDA|nr:hypothetical protein Dda_6770 [Drechslerella dactyloides]
MPRQEISLGSAAGKSRRIRGICPRHRFPFNAIALFNLVSVLTEGGSRLCCIQHFYFLARCDVGICTVEQWLQGDWQGSIEIVPTVDPID